MVKNWSHQSSKAGWLNEASSRVWVQIELISQRVYKKVSHPGGIFEEELVMSEDATQQLLIARFDRLLSLVEPIAGQIENLEKRVNERLDKLEKQQGELQKQQTDLSATLGSLAIQQAEFGAKLDSLETKVDQRLRETRPIWESVLSQIAELDKKIDTRVEELRSETSSGFRAVDRKIGALSKNLIDMTAEIQELREMVEKIEAQPA